MNGKFRGMSLEMFKNLTGLCNSVPPDFRTIYTFSLFVFVGYQFLARPDIPIHTICE